MIPNYTVRKRLYKLSDHPFIIHKSIFFKEKFSLTSMLCRNSQSYYSFLLVGFSLDRRKHDF